MSKFKTDRELLDHMHKMSDHIEFDTKRQTDNSGDKHEFGVIRLKHPIHGIYEIGFYEFGVCFATNAPIEFFNPWVSFRNLHGETVPYTNVRNIDDTKMGVYLHGDGVIGTEHDELKFGPGTAVDNNVLQAKSFPVTMTQQGLFVWDMRDRNKGICISVENGVPTITMVQRVQEPISTTIPN